MSKPNPQIQPVAQRTSFFSSGPQESKENKIKRKKKELNNLQQNLKNNPPESKTRFGFTLKNSRLGKVESLKKNLKNLDVNVSSLPQSAPVQSAGPASASAEQKVQTELGKTNNQVRQEQLETIAAALKPNDSSFAPSKPINLPSQNNTLNKIQKNINAIQQKLQSSTNPSEIQGIDLNNLRKRLDSIKTDRSELNGQIKTIIEKQLITLKNNKNKKILELQQAPQQQQLQQAPQQQQQLQQAPQQQQLQLQQLQQKQPPPVPKRPNQFPPSSSQSPSQSQPRLQLPNLPQLPTDLPSSNKAPVQNFNKNNFPILFSELSQLSQNNQNELTTPLDKIGAFVSAILNKIYNNQQIDNTQGVINELLNASKLIQISNSNNNKTKQRKDAIKTRILSAIEQLQNYQQSTPSSQNTPLGVPPNVTSMNPQQLTNIQQLNAKIKTVNKTFSSMKTLLGQKKPGVNQNNYNAVKQQLAYLKNARKILIQQQPQSPSKFSSFFTKKTTNNSPVTQYTGSQSPPVTPPPIPVSKIPIIKEQISTSISTQANIPSDISDAAKSVLNFARYKVKDMTKSQQDQFAQIISRVKNDLTAALAQQATATSPYDPVEEEQLGGSRKSLRTYYCEGKKLKAEKPKEAAEKFYQKMRVKNRRKKIIMTIESKKGKYNYSAKIDKSGNVIIKTI